MTVGDLLAARSWTALGSYVEVLVDDAARLEAVCAAVARRLADIDRSCSRFREDSDLVRANRAAGRWVRVDPLLAEAVALARQAAELTGGLVDPLLGRRLVELGYDRDLALVRAGPAPGVPDAGPAALPVGPGWPGRDRPDWRALQVDPEGAVRVPAGAALDLGATGKAFAADLIAGTVPPATGAGFVVSLGGDVAVGRRDGAVGRRDGAADRRWRVEVTERRGGRDPARETVGIGGGGLATSSTLTRTWRRAGRGVHHLIDPRTGQPARPFWRTVTVAADSCLAANTASTAAVVLGPDAESWLAERDLAARLVAAGGRVTRVGGWPEPVG